MTIRSDHVAIEKVPANYNYIWIGLNYTQTAFHITARDSRQNYGKALYVMGGVSLGDSHSLHGALVKANTLANIRRTKFTHGVRVSEEAALKQRRDDWAQDRMERLQGANATEHWRNAVQAYENQFDAEYPGLYTF